MNTVIEFCFTFMIVCCAILVATGMACLIWIALDSWRENRKWKR
jgi:threonine/homoserine/homoserine lactone efflux protein